MPRRRLISWATVILSFTLCSQGRAFDQQSIERLITDEHLTSLDAVLSRLPQSLLSNYALVFNSRSLHESSFAYPRAILFGDDAKLVVTFNGDPAQRGYDALEAMQFDEAGQRFIFKEFMFTGSAKGAVSEVRISKNNPEKCLACHTSTAKPVWDTHPTWPGVYGERYRSPLTDKEIAGLQLFIKSVQPQNSRYRLLKNIELFNDPRTFNPDARKLYSGTQAEPPNAELSRLLTHLNAKAIVARMATSPSFPQYRLALLAALTPDCDVQHGFFPPDTNAQLWQNYKQFAQKEIDANQQQAAFKLLRLSVVPFSANQEGNESDNLTKLRYLVETGLQQTTTNWSLALEKNTYDFKAPQSMRVELDTLLRARLAKEEPELTDLALQRDTGATEKYCRFLRTRSLAAGPQLSAQVSMQTSITPAGSFDPNRSPPALEICISCHSIIGPYIPFDEPGDLAKALHESGYKQGTLLQAIQYRMSPNAGQQRMPRSQNLTDEEQKSLLDYFLQLSKLKKQ